jgi:hypothetical protein
MGATKEEVDELRNEVAAQKKRPAAECHARLRR